MGKKFLRKSINDTKRGELYRLARGNPMLGPDRESGNNPGVLGSSRDGDYLPLRGLLISKNKN